MKKQTKKKHLSLKMCQIVSCTICFYEWTKQTNAKREIKIKTKIKKIYIYELKPREQIYPSPRWIKTLFRYFNT